MKVKTIEEAKKVIEDFPDEDDFICKNLRVFTGLDGEADDNSIQLSDYWRECKNMMSEEDRQEELWAAPQLKNIEDYLTHLKRCNVNQDWTEAQQAMGDTPMNLRDESWYIAYEEMRENMNKCTCGLHYIVDWLSKKHNVILK